MKRSRLTLIESAYGRSPLIMLHELDNQLRSAHRTYAQEPTAQNAKHLALQHHRAGDHQSAINVLSNHHSSLDHEGHQLLHSAATHRVEQLHNKHQQQGGLEHHELDDLHRALVHSVGSDEHARAYGRISRDYAHSSNPSHLAPGNVTRLTHDYRSTDGTSTMRVERAEAGGRLYSHQINRINHSPDGGWALHHASLPATVAHEWHPNGQLSHSHQSYLQHGELHRDGGPAYTTREYHPNGVTSSRSDGHYQHGVLSRENGPHEEHRNWNSQGTLLNYTHNHLANTPGGYTHSSASWGHDGAPRKLTHSRVVDGQTEYDAGDHTTLGHSKDHPRGDPNS